MRECRFDEGNVMIRVDVRRGLIYGSEGTVI